MAKRFKRGIYRVISSTIRSCRSKDPSILPHNPLPSALAPPISSPPVPPVINVPAAFSAIHFPVHRESRRSLKHHLSNSTAFMSLPSNGPILSNSKPEPHDHPHEFKWQKDENWHVVAKIRHQKAPRRKIYLNSEGIVPPTPQLPSEVKKKKGRGRKKKAVAIPSSSRSSGDSGWFSSDDGGVDPGEEEETNTLVSSSICISTDQCNSTRETPHHDIDHGGASRIKRRTAPRRRGSSKKHSTAAEGEIPARLSMFKKLIPCTVEGKVKDSFAIVKKSENPYEDFKKSMMDMILEKEMFEEKDLEQLLQCFLSLNSRHYHGIIVDAFCDIWHSIFHPSTPHYR